MVRFCFQNIDFCVGNKSGRRQERNRHQNQESVNGCAGYIEAGEMG